MLPKILSSTAWISLSGAYPKVVLRTDYNGWHSLLTPTITVREDHRAFSERLPRARQDHHVTYFNNRHVDNWDVRLTSTCGGMVEVRGFHEVYILGLMAGTVVRLFDDEASSYAHESQPRCSCAGTSTNLLEPADDPWSSVYDPYAPPSNATSDCDDTAPASGPQYVPGDSTGGETVDWGTGKGTGGSSSCGQYAVVEYVCIDVWVEGTGWVEWSCGYVTTC